MKHQREEIIQLINWQMNWTVFKRSVADQDMKKFLTHKRNTNQNTEILSHPSLNGCHQENKQQMLAGMWVKKGPLHFPCWWECKSVWKFLKKLKLEWSSDWGYILHIHVYSSTIHNFQAMESALGPTNRWMD
jgi:dTDP-4-dehydrorhamnose 3,5-epimerase-like enzyme